MNFVRSLRAVATASGEGSLDWDAVTAAAKAATEPGSIDLDPGEAEGYAGDVRDARAGVREVSGLDFDLPDAVEVQNRHHWIDANVETFRRVMAPLEERPLILPGFSRRLNTATMATMLSYLGRNVLGQYDPLLLAEADEHALYFVRPNIRDIAGELEVDYDRFRRWIAFHEVTHAAEFGAAPWLSSRLEGRMSEAIEALASGRFDRDALRDLTTTMTAVEGYAEFVMDRAFDDEYADLRERLDARRRDRGPLATVLSHLLGLEMKRRQYERGKAFFDAVAAARGVDAASVAWDRPSNLPTDTEIDEPAHWIARVDP